MSEYVVMEAQLGARKYLAWCQTDGGPGFTDITYTNFDGSPADIAIADVRITRHLFTAPGAPDPEAFKLPIYTREFLAPDDVKIDDLITAAQAEIGHSFYVTQVDTRPVRWPRNSIRVFITMEQADLP